MLEFLSGYAACIGILFKSWMFWAVMLIFIIGGTIETRHEKEHGQIK